jgi:predicted patatin/cPLA2 family phospholipase
MLIAEANKTRELRGFGPKDWVYKGYGIYQYDLQYVVEDESFFREKKWYKHANCLDRLIKELHQKYEIYQDIWKAIKAYNGLGDGATRYANNVIQFATYGSEIEG